MSCRSTGVLIGLLLLVAPLASADDIPLRDWSVPSTSSRLSALGDIGNPGVFVAVTPCRVADTRNAAGAYGGPALVANASRAFDIDSGPCTGIPANASAFSLNFTIVASAGAYQNAFLTVWPTGASQPTVSTLNFDGGQLRANAAIVPAGTGGSVSVFVNAAAHMIIDINGYYTNYPNTGNQLFLSGSFSAAAAIVGFNYANPNGSHGVGGYAGGTGVVHGVQGEIGTGAAALSAGVHGIGVASTARTFGVYGESAANVNDAAGVLGRTTVGTPPIIDNLASPAGVRGEGASRGAVGIAGPTGVGVRGYSVDAAGALQAFGSLGSGSSYGVYANGNLGASGTKTFVEPHPTDPSMVIKFVSLEGPEAGTYFRGTASTRGGVCVIDVPESFRLVTDEAGLTVQLTTVGSPARAWVESESLDRIVVRSTADTKLHYLVQGVRKAYRDFEPIVAGDEFVPSSPADRLPLWLSEEGRRRLISNGTFHADGTVNMETAERAGWAQKWREAEPLHE